jgi:hypothetical protein
MERITVNLPNKHLYRHNDIIAYYHYGTFKGKGIICVNISDDSCVSVLFTNNVRNNYLFTTVDGFSFKGVHNEVLISRKIT